MKEITQIMWDKINNNQKMEINGQKYILIIKNNDFNKNVIESQIPVIIKN